MHNSDIKTSLFQLSFLKPLKWFRRNFISTSKSRKVISVSFNSLPYWFTIKH